MLKRSVWVAYLLFFMMLFVPTTYPTVKAVLIALVLGMIVIRTLLRGRLALHPVVPLWTLFMVVTGLGFMYLGWINGGPGALRVGTVYVLWPLVYTLFVAGAVKQEVIDGLIRVLVFATLAIGLYSLSFILHATGRLPDFLYIEIDQGQIFASGSGRMGLRLYSLNTLAFSVPFLMAALWVWPKGSTMPISRSWLWLALVFGMVSVLASGRRALWLLVAVAPVIAFSLRMFLLTRFKAAALRRVGWVSLGMLLMALGAYGYLRFAYGVDIVALVDSFLLGFDFTNYPDAVVRREQFWALVEGWSESPLFGKGHGTGVSYVRSEGGWGYELSYVALLFQTGIAGLLIYASGVMWIFLMGFKVSRSGGRLGLYMFPVLVGTGCFLIANATNPYLGKYDYIWVIFLPIALINSWLLTRRKKSLLAQKAS